MVSSLFVFPSFYFRSADVNGMVDPTRVPVNETSLAFYQPYYHPSFAHMNHHHLQHCIPPAVLSAQSGQIALLPTPHSHAQPNDNSPVNSETSSPPPSPLLPPVTVLSLDQGQGHVIGHAPGPSLQVMSQLPAVFTDSVTASETKLLKKSKDDLLDSLDSDDDRTAGSSIISVKSCLCFIVLDWSCKQADTYHSSYCSPSPSKLFPDLWLRQSLRCLHFLECSHEVRFSEVVKHHLQFSIWMSSVLSK